MKAHLAFVDTNRTGLRAVAYAVAHGYQVSLVMPRDNTLYCGSPENDHILAKVPSTTWIETARDKEPVIAALEAISSRQRVDAVFCLEESSLESVGAACADLGMRFTSYEAIRTCRNKWMCRDVLAHHGIPSAEYQLVHNEQDLLEGAHALGFPLVLKPVSGLASIYASVVKDEAALRRAYGSWRSTVADRTDNRKHVLERGLMLEQYIHGPLVSVEVACNETGVRPLMITGRAQGPVDETCELGFEIPAPIPARKREEFIAYTTKVIEAVGLDLGLFHVELIDGADGPVLVEVNARLIGGDGPQVIEDATGQSLYGLLIETHTGANLSGSGLLPVKRCISTRKVEATGDVSEKELDRMTRTLREFEADGTSLNITQLAAAGSPLHEGSVLARFRIYGDEPATTCHAARKLFSDIVNAVNGKVHQ